MEHDQNQIMLERNGEQIATDAEIAPLVEGIWAEGLVTLATCQSFASSGQVMIEFASAKDAALFLEMVANRDQHLGPRVVGPRVMSKAEPGEWMVVPHVLSSIKQCDDGEYRWTAYEVCIAMIVLFPRSDLEAVTRIFEKMPPPKLGQDTTALAEKIRKRMSATT
jgi:hypothetical protein